MLNTDTLKQKLEKAYQLTLQEVNKLHTGRANAALIEDIRVEAYEGSAPMKIIELGTISTPKPQTLMIQVFDASITEKIAKAISQANIGLNPNIAGNLIRINIPPLSQERRQELVKVAKKKIEEGKILIRQIRHEIMDAIKDEFESKNISEDEAKHQEKQVQQLIDQYNQKLEELYDRKEKDILTV
ncbi:MAG: ribosome recycling factor [bacterium]|nr:ribosome recycling factor [bacterium]